MFGFSIFLITIAMIEVFFAIIAPFIEIPTPLMPMGFAIFLVVLAIYFGVMHFLIEITKNTRKSDKTKAVQEDKETEEYTEEEYKEKVKVPHLKRPKEVPPEETEKGPFRNKVLIIVIALIVVSLLIPFFISFFGG